MQIVETKTVKKLNGDRKNIRSKKSASWMTGLLPEVQDTQNLEKALALMVKSSYSKSALIIIFIIQEPGGVPFDQGTPKNLFVCLMVNR